MFIVRLKGLEPPRREAPDPKSGVATNYTTAAKWVRSYGFFFIYQRILQILIDLSKKSLLLLS